MRTTTYNTVVTINRELNELSYSFFSDIVKKSPVKVVELEPGKWAFNDNEIGQGRNYFCDMFGYSLTQEEFEFEYFDDPQTLEDPEASESDKYECYTQNGWTGSNYGSKSSTKGNEYVIRRGKSLQNIIDQTRRLNGNAGRNWFWSFKREKLINKIYTTYVANIQKLGAFSYPEKKFTREEYTGITPTKLSEPLGDLYPWNTKKNNALLVISKKVI